MGLIIDYFAGGGGASTAMEQALGRTVDIAVNHDADAIAMHEANHPHTLHLQEDVWAVSPAETCAGRPIDVMWFSPDCKHFSRAKGGAPVSKRVRGLAWVVLRWAALPKWQRPRVIFLENVEEFQTWGPLCKRGRPIAKDMGETFRLWVSHLEALGYRVEWRVLKACDYGAPTIRKRLFLVARCDGEPIRWPEQTHANPALKKRGMKPWRTAADIIDWSIPCPSIFERKIPLKEKTMARIARGIMRYVVNNPQPFIVPITHTKAGNMAYPTSEPLRTITTAKGGEMAIVAPTLVQTGYGERKGQAPRSLNIEAPLGTVVAGGAKHALIAAFLAQHNDGPRNQGLTGRAADAPISTITGRGTQQQLVEATIQKVKSEHDQHGDGTQGNRDGDDLHPLGRNDLAEYAGREGTVDTDHASPGRVPAQERVSRGRRKVGRKTVSGSGASPDLGIADRPDTPEDGHQSQGRREDEQRALQSGTGDAQRKSSSRLPDGPDGQEASHSSAGVGRGHGGRESASSDGAFLPGDRGEAGRLADDSIPRSERVAALLIKYYGNETEGHDLTNPLGTVTTRDRFGLVTVAGAEYMIADIGMRMLAPHELYAAQGFPPDYIIQPMIAGKPMGKSASIARCGNSVSPPVARALVEANAPMFARIAGGSPRFAEAV